MPTTIVTPKIKINLNSFLGVKTLIGADNNAPNNYNSFTDQTGGGSDVYGDSQQKILALQCGKKYSNSLMLGTLNGRKKINHDVFFNKTRIVEIVKILTSSKLTSFYNRVPIKRIKQLSSYYLWNHNPKDSKTRIFLPSFLKVENGNDMMVKRYSANVNGESPNLSRATEDSFNWNKQFDSQGPNGTQYVSLVKHNVTQDTCLVVPALIFKGCLEMFSFQKHINNSGSVYRQLNECSHWNTTKHSVFDLQTNQPAQILSRAKPTDSGSKTSFFVPKGKEKIYARLAFILTCFKTPFYVTDNQFKKTLPMCINNYYHCVPVLEMLWFCQDEAVMNSVLADVSTTWTTNQAELQEVIELFKLLMPHKKSCLIADQLIFSQQWMLLAEANGLKKNDFMCPSTAVPATIGIIAVTETQYFGYDGHNINFQTLTAARISKQQNLETTIHVIAQSHVRKVVSMSTENEVSGTTRNKTLLDLQFKAFDGSFRSDQIYDFLFECDKNATFYCFFPSILKRLYFKYYPDIRNNIKSTVFETTGNSYFSSYKMMKGIDVNPYSLAFDTGLEIELARSEGNQLIKSDVDTLDHVQTLAVNDYGYPVISDVIDLTNWRARNVIKEDTDLYYIKNPNIDIAVVNLNNATIVLEEVKPLTDLVSDINYQDIEPAVIVVPTEVFVPLIREIRTETVIGRIKDSIFGNFNYVKRTASRFVREANQVAQFTAIIVEAEEIMQGIGVKYFVDSNPNRRLINLIVKSRLSRVTSSLSEIISRLLEINVNLVVTEDRSGFNNSNPIGSTDDESDGDGE